MRFYQNLNKLAIRPYNRGFQAPSTALFNTDLGQYEIKSVEEEIDDLEIAVLPDFLEVLVEIVPIHFDNTSITATYRYFDQTFPSVPLYHAEKKQFVKGLNFKFADVMKIKMPQGRESFLVKGSTFEGLSLQADNQSSTEELIVGQFNFDYRSQATLMHFNDKKEISIWPYAGFYKEGCKLQDIQQMFFTLEEKGEVTYVHTSFLQEWHNQGRFPPGTYHNKDKTVIFKTPTQDRYIFLVDAIRQGKMVVSLTSSEQGERAIKQAYQSIDILQHGGGRAFIQFIKG